MDAKVTALEIEFSFGPLVWNIHSPVSKKGKGLAYNPRCKNHSALQRTTIGNVVDVIGIAFSWPPGSHVWRRWYARGQGISFGGRVNDDDACGRSGYQTRAKSEFGSGGD
jgi:hypothetical protein